MNEIGIERTPHTIAVEIYSIKGQTRNVIMLSCVEIGRRLVEAKAMLLHGEWGDWLKDSVEYSQSTANNLMQIYREYGSDPVKIAMLGNLSYTKAIALLGLPEEEREQFAEEHDLASMSTRELQQAVKEKQEAERKLAEATAGLENAQKESLQQQQLFKKQLAEANKKVQEEHQHFETVSESYDRLEKQNHEHYERAEQLRKQLETALAAGNSEEAATLREQLEEANRDLAAQADKIEELEAQLKAKPIEASATVEVIPPDVQKELDDLRAKASPAVLQFRAHFDTLTGAFRTLLEDLAEIPAPDQERYRGAVSKLIVRMQERL